MQGEPSDSLVIIKSGCIGLFAMHCSDEIGEQREMPHSLVYTVVNGDTIGDMDVFDAAPRNFTAKATRESEIGTISRAKFRYDLGTDSLACTVAPSPPLYRRAFSARCTSTANSAAGTCTNHTAGSRLRIHCGCGDGNSAALTRDPPTTPATAACSSTATRDAWSGKWECGPGRCDRHACLLGVHCRPADLHVGVSLPSLFHLSSR